MVLHSIFWLLAICGLAHDTGAFRWSFLQQSSNVISVPVTTKVSLPCEFELTNNEKNQMKLFFLLTWSREKPSGSGGWETLTVNSTDYGVKILPKNNNGHFEIISGNKLVINNVRTDENTFYKCTLRSMFSSNPSTKRINVQYKPTGTKISKSTDAVISQPLKIKCTARANPLPTYMFYHGKVLLQSSTSQEYTINSYKTQHSGQYLCIPSNFLGSGPAASIQVTSYGEKTDQQHDNKVTEVKTGSTLVGVVGAIAGVLLLIIVLLLVYLIKRPAVQVETTGQLENHGQRYQSDGNTLEMHENRRLDVSNPDYPLAPITSTVFPSPPPPYHSVLETHENRGLDVNDGLFVSNPVYIIPPVTSTTIGSPISSALPPTPSQSGEESQVTAII